MTGENLLNRYKEALAAFDSIMVFYKTVIVEEVLKGTNPISIYLTGSFGRNEGSLHLSEKGIAPLRDFDVLIVLNKLVDNEVLNRIRASIHERVGLRNPFSREFKFKGFTFWLTQVELKGINAFPLLKFYELKEASTLLWGRDIRSGISLDFKSLSAYNGVLILFSKVEGLLGLLDVHTLKPERGSMEAIDLVYECMKTYVEIGTCLSLLAKVYAPSFVQRCIRISGDFKVLFPELEKMNSALPSLMVTYAYRRLLVEDDYLASVNLGKVLVATVRDLKIAIWYYLRRSYQIDIACSPTSSCMLDEYAMRLNTRVLEDLFEQFIKTKSGLKSRVLTKTASKLYVRYTSLRFFVEGRTMGFKISPTVLFTRRANVMMKLWVVGFMLLDCVRDDFSIDELKLRLAAERLCKFIDTGLQKRLFERDLAEKFPLFQRMTLDLLNLADKVFHLKE
jgi:hypothetical protein